MRGEGRVIAGALAGLRVSCEVPDRSAADLAGLDLWRLGELRLTVYQGIYVRPPIV